MDTSLIYILISNFMNFSIPVFFYYKAIINISKNEYTRYIIFTFIAFIIVTWIDFNSYDHTYFFINSFDIYNDYDNILKYIIILFISIYPLLFKGVSLIEKIFWILSLNVMISIINTFCITLLLSVFGYDAIISTNGVGYEKIISIIIIRVVQIFFIYIFSKNIVFTKYVNKKILFILCIICVLNQLISSVILRDILIKSHNRTILTTIYICSIFIVQMQSFYMLNIVSKEMISSVILRDILIKSYNRTILTTIYVCSIFIVQMQSFYMLNIVSKEMQRLFILDMTLKNKQNDEDIIRMYKEMRGLRHDFKNHISAILALIERGAKESSIKYIYELDNKINKFDKYVYTENIAVDSILANKIKIANLIERGAKESSIKYIYELDNKINKFDKYVYTENIAVDSILANKIKIAKEKNIDINLELDIQTQINIPDIDMCTILGNLIDNSIEACEKLETEKIINMRIVTKGNNIIIKIRNNTNGKLKEHNGRFITTKSYGMHGIGLEQIDNIVRKYKGNNIIIKIRNNTNGKLKEHNGRFITTKSYGMHGIGLEQIDNIVRKYGGYISRIKIRNNTNGKLKEHNGRFITTKSYGMHGIGLEQIDNIVRKYGGYISRKHENNVFDTSILMQCNNF